LNDLAKNLPDLKNTAFNALLSGAGDLVKGPLIKAALTKIVSLVSPAGAAITYVTTVYNGVKFVLDNRENLRSLMKEFFGYTDWVIRGPSEKVGEWVEKLLTKAAPLALSFLASQVGLSKLPEGIRGVLGKLDVTQWIYKGAQTLWSRAKDGLGKLTDI